MKVRKHYRLMNEAATGAADGAAAGAGTGQGGEPASAATTPPAQTQNSTQPWHEAIGDAELRQYVEGKGFKDAGEAAKALRDLEASHATPDDVAAYKLPVPEGDDGKFASQAAQWMKEAGIPVGAGQKLAQQWNAFQAEQAKAAQVAQQQAGERAIADLRGEWGQQYDQNVELGRKAMRTFGVPAEVVEKMAGAMGDAQTIRVFQAIGKSMSESTLNPGGEGGSTSPAGDEYAARAARMFPSMKDAK